jgi:hypothetical protein
VEKIEWRGAQRERIDAGGGSFVSNGIALSSPEFRGSSSRQQWLDTVAARDHRGGVLKNMLCACRNILNVLSNKLKQRTNDCLGREKQSCLTFCKIKAV